MNTITTSTLNANLAALAVCSPRAAKAISLATARSDVDFVATEEHVVSASIGEFTLSGLVHRALASRRRPLAEATKLADRVDITRSAAVVVTGFAMGYHVAELARRMKQTGVIIVYEPDVALLRSVLEKVDHSAWIRLTNLLLITEAPDEAALGDLLQPVETVLAMGIAMLEHPPSVARLGDDGPRFVGLLARVMQGVQTNVATTMVQTQTTLRNLAQNLDHYALGAGIGELQNACAGRPAIVVSAGPSLKRNMHLLRDPAVRDRIVIIAVQTVLKPLLRAGIKPHFVCALDYHEISARFYEGVTPQDVEGITLVVEPKVNPAVTSAFPGVIRCAGDTWLDEILGKDLSRPMGKLRQGATVAHLCYELARWLGCDPAILIGQDLGFTDGQYYAPGASIHDVWAAEIGEFNTLENYEWQRIARHRSHLRKRTDVLGREIYSDEQMDSYLQHFQRDFKRDTDAGLTVIDATEGGVLKLHTRVMTLASALASHTPAKLIGDELQRGLASGENAPHAGLAGPARPNVDSARAKRVLSRLADLQRDATKVAEISKQTAKVLGEMIEHRDDQQRVNGLIDAAQRLAQKVSSLEPAYSIVHQLNQTGAFNRTRADRAIHTETALEPLEVQRRQMQRDLTNVTWLGDSADALTRILGDARVSIRTGQKVTRDVGAGEAMDAGQGTGAEASPVDIVVLFRDGISATGETSDPMAEVTPGHTSLSLTLTRLLRCRRARGICVLAESSQRARLAGGAAASDPRVHVVTTPRDPRRYAPEVLRAFRSLSAHSWRGGPLSVFDELVDPGMLADVLQASGATAGLMVASDWCLVDPDACDRLIERYHEDTRGHRIAFCQGAPGLAGYILSADIAAQHNRNAHTAGIHASMGGMLAYVPVVAMADFIAKSMCVQVSPVARDLPLRCIGDTTEQARQLCDALIAAGLDPATAEGQELARVLTRDQLACPPEGPRHLTITLSGTERDARRMDEALASDLIDEFGRLTRESRVGGPATLTLIDPFFDHPATPDLLRRARTFTHVCVHLRSTFARDTLDVSTLVPPSGPALADVISLDLIADSPDLHARLLPEAGASGFLRSRTSLSVLLAARREPEGSPARGVQVPFVLPRLTRRDEVYAQVEAVVDSLIMLAGWCVLDPMTSAPASARIQPLPLPTLAQQRDALTALRIDATNADEARRVGLLELWKSHIAEARRRGVLPTPDSTNEIATVGPGGST